MASYYKIKGDPDEAKQAIEKVKSQLKPGILFNALDILEKEGEVDLPKLAHERGVDPAGYAHPTKQKVFNVDLGDYLKPGTSPYLKSLKDIKKKAPDPGTQREKRGYEGSFDIIENPDGTISLVDKTISSYVPITKDASLFDRKAIISKSLKFPNEFGWSDSKKEESAKLKKKWKFDLVKKGILTHDEVWDKFRIVPSNISDYEDELGKFIPKFEKLMLTVNENYSPVMKKSLFKNFIREEIKSMLSQKLSPSSGDIKEMRDWAKDCQWGDISDEDIDEMSDQEIIKGIKKHYSGGVEQFLKDINITETTMVDKNTDISKVNDIAKQEKKDPSTVTTAIQQAKTSGKPITIS